MEACEQADELAELKAQMAAKRAGVVAKLQGSVRQPKRLSHLRCCQTAAPSTPPSTDCLKLSRSAGRTGLGSSRS